MASCHLMAFRNNTPKSDVYVKNHENGESITLKPGESKDLNWPVPDASSQHYLEEGRYLEIKFTYAYAVNQDGTIFSAESMDSRAHSQTQILVYRNDYKKVLQHIIRYGTEISDQIADGDFDKTPAGLLGYQYFQRTGTTPVLNEIPNAGNNTSYEFEVHSELSNLGTTVAHGQYRPPVYENKLTFKYV